MAKKCKTAQASLVLRDRVSDFKSPPHWLFLEYKSAPPLDLVVADPCHAYTKQVQSPERPLKQRAFQIRLGLFETKFLPENHKPFFNLKRHVALRACFNTITLMKKGPSMLNQYLSSSNTEVRCLIHALLNFRTIFSVKVAFYLLEKA